MEDASRAGPKARDRRALAAVMHAPHHRLAGGRFQLRERPEDHSIAGVLARAGGGWARSAGTSAE